MLSLFRRPGADLQIDVDKTVVQVGDEVRARVTLVPKQDFDVRQGKVELICTETYVQMTSSQYGQHYHRRARTLSLEGGSFMEGGTVRAGLPHSGSVRLVVPAGALPTLTGATVSKIDPGISWAVTASLDVARGVTFNRVKRSPLTLRPRRRTGNTGRLPLNPGTDSVCLR